MGDRSFLGRHRLPAWGLAAVAAFAIASFPACAGRKARREAREKAQQQAQAGTLQASELRERALDELDRAVKDTDPAVRANAIEAYSLAPARAEPVVAAALRDPNEGVRSVAAMVVGETAMSGQSGALRPLVNDRSPYVRASAIYGLARTGGQVDPSPLSNMLLGDPSSRVRSHAVFILGELRDRSAAPMIRQAAATPIPRASEIETRLFQLQAAEALVKLGDDSRMEPILAALFPATPQDLEATALACQILGELGHKPVVGDLNNLAGEQDRTGNRMPAEVRLAAAGALAKLGRTHGVSWIADEFAKDPAQVLRAQAASVYGDLRDPASLAKLEPMLSDGSGLVRVSAAAAILKIAGGS